MIVDADVVVVGAGPVGMLATALLSAAGALTVITLERRDGTSDEPKAISLDDESLRTIARAGLADAVLPIITPGLGTRYYGADGAPLLDAGFRIGPVHGYPFKNPFAQPELESSMLGALRARPGVDLRFGTEVVGIAETDELVEVTTARGDTVRARFVVAADGARSSIRKALGIAMDGVSLDEPWLVVDTTGDGHRERFGMHFGTPARPHVIVPGRDGRCRYEFRLFAGESVEGRAPDFELIRSVLAPYRPIASHEVERAVVYRFHALAASHWSTRRIFLVGDAAHLMPPFAGQGLNSGFRDVANLSWKIEEACEGSLDLDDLDSYEEERRPHAESSIALSRRLGEIVMTTDPERARARDARVRDKLRAPEGRRYLERMEYRPAHRYEHGLRDPGDHPALGAMVPQPRVFVVGSGQQLLLDELLGPGWALLGIDVAASDWREVGPTDRLRRVHVVATDTFPDPLEGIPVAVALEPGDARLPDGPLFLVIRPDRFVAAAWRPGEPIGPLARRLLSAADHVTAREDTP
jgi:3-(3-hydroxy-phenyl)propionate hydroxylase